MRTARTCVFLWGVLLVAVFWCQGCKRKSHSDGISSERTALSTLQTALDAFRIDVGRYPSTQEGLEALRVRPASDAEGWKGPYIVKPIHVDPRGNEYQYVCPGRHNQDGFDLWSFGRDGKDGTKDDVTNWE